VPEAAGVVFERDDDTVRSLDTDGRRERANHAIGESDALGVLSEVVVRVGVATLDERPDVVGVQLGGCHGTITFE
jgi:hypothetical protein